MYQLSDIYSYAEKLNIPEEFIPRNTFDSFTVKLTLHGHEGRHGYPKVSVKLNNDILISNTIVGEQIFQVTALPKRRRNLFTIEFTNKENDDTVVDADGKFVKDKFVEIKRLEFNEIPLEPLKFFRYEPIYHPGYLAFEPDPPKVIYSDCLSFKGVVTIYIEQPVGLFLSRQYFKDSNFVAAKSDVTVTNFKQLADFYTKLAHKD
jgi:hypothetical protein